MSTDHFDAILIGSGQAGTPLASALARAGWKTALVEKQHIGGTCLNEGCTPTKTMIASGRVAYLARRAADYGVNTGPVTIDMERVRQRKREIVESFVGGSERRIDSAGVTLLRGEARFMDADAQGAHPGAHTLEVLLMSGERRQISAGTVVINTGARPSTPDLPGLDGGGLTLSSGQGGVPYYDSTSIMELDCVPDHLLVLGGGYVGLEFGQLFRRFGSQVTIVQRDQKLLAREDDDIAEAVAEIMRQDDIQVLLETAASCVKRNPGGSISLAVRTPTEERVLEGTHVLVAAGRSPNTERLNLPAVGVATDPRGFIQVNERLETNISGIYAVGDVKGGPAFTHISYDDYRVLRTNLLEGGAATTKGRSVPYVVFIDPQLGRIGLSETEARQQGRKIRVAKIPMNYVSRALEVDEARGFMKAVVDAENDQILGFTVLGLEGGELMATVQVAMMGGLRYTALREAIFAHPTLSESLNTLFTSIGD
jgi:pyruvate/2-oxoglutarate dehydrogenase complex dihydrolipoamide dehydrogenase (E3) component